MPINTAGFALPKPSVKEGRVILSENHLRNLRRLWWQQSKRTCHLCERPILDFSDYTLDHLRPKGMGGGSRDDSENNLRPAHWKCNIEKGSKRLPKER